MTKAEIIDYLYEIHAHADYSIEDIADDLAVPVRRGRWEEDVYNEDSFWRCTACGFVSEAHAANLLYKFCPNCGADMRKDGDHAEGTIQKERS